MHPLVKLAKKAVEKYIKEGEIISPPLDFPQEFLTRKSGTFVTIEKNKKLRGCIGTYLPTQENIAKEVIQNAISSATRDPRFPPVSEEELPYLSYVVYVLYPPELVSDISKLNPKKYGVIVKTIPKEGEAQKSALLLPDLEGVETVEDQLSITCQKGGIDPVAEEIVIYRFKVDKYQ